MNSRSWIGILATAAVVFAGLNLWQWQRSPSVELSEQEITDRFHVIWGHKEDTWRKNSFLGVRTLQNPLDVWVTFEIIHKVKPSEQSHRSMGNAGFLINFGDGTTPIPSRNVIKIAVVR